VAHAPQGATKLESRIRCLEAISFEGLSLSKSRQSVQVQGLEVQYHQSMRTRLFIAAISAAVALTAAVFIVAARPEAHGAPVKRAHLIHIKGQAVQVSTSDAAFGFAAFGMRFSPEPDAAPPVTMAAAVSTALRFSGAGSSDGQLLPNVNVSAEYGLFSDDEYGSNQADGTFKPRYQDIPAWIVTFTGPGLNVYSSGPPSADGSQRVNHEETVVIDGQTGNSLLDLT
jgi:hypothetical protein